MQKEIILGPWFDVFLWAMVLLTVSIAISIAVFFNMVIFMYFFVK
jgi:hypothetical protein